MKQSLILAGILAIGFAKAQTGRVGINTEKPRATLDIVGRPFKAGDAEDGKLSRGVVFPHISEEQKAAFTDLTEGLIIYNTTKHCVEVWNGTSWKCVGKNAKYTFKNKCEPHPDAIMTGTRIGMIGLSARDENNRELKQITDFSYDGKTYTPATVLPHFDDVNGAKKIQFEYLYGVIHENVLLGTDAYKYTGTEAFKLGNRVITGDVYLPEALCDKIARISCDNGGHSGKRGLYIELRDDVRGSVTCEVIE